MDVLTCGNSSKLKTVTVSVLLSGKLLNLSENVCLCVKVSNIRIHTTTLTTTLSVSPLYVYIVTFLSNISHSDLSQTLQLCNSMSNERLHTKQLLIHIQYKHTYIYRHVRCMLRIKDDIKNSFMVWMEAFLNATIF